jgi:NADPH:quinone reductase-like Zn-dependent oxidoreductase
MAANGDPDIHVNWRDGYMRHEERVLILGAAGRVGHISVPQEGPGWVVP